METISPKSDVILLGRFSRIEPRIAVRSLPRSRLLSFISEISRNYPNISDIVNKYTKIVNKTKILAPTSVSVAQLLILLEPMSTGVGGTIINTGLVEAEIIIDNVHSYKLEPIKEWGKFQNIRF